MGSKLFAHKLRLSLSEDTLTIDYMAEVPIRVIQKELEALESQEKSLFSSHKIQELGRALHISVNGKPLQMESVDLGMGHVRENPRFTVFEVRLEGTLPPNSTSLSLQNGAYPDHVAFFSTEVLVSEGISVSECSLFEIQEGKPLQDRSGRWWIEESLRELNLTFEATDPGVLALMRKLGGTKGAYESASSAYKRNALREVHSNEENSRIFLLVLGLCIGLVFMMRR